MILDDALSKNEATRIVFTNPRCLGVTTTFTLAAKEGDETEATSLGFVGFKTSRPWKIPTSFASILYVTEGTLIRVLENAPFSHILIDEFQERTLDVDVLVMRLRQILRAGSAVRIVIMTATCDVGLLERYFSEFDTKVVTLCSTSWPITDYYIDEFPAFNDRV